MYSTFKKFCGGQVSTMAAAVLLTIAGQASAQTPSGVLATHSAPLYLAGSTLDISCTFTVPAGRHLLSLLWSPALPSGWTLVSVTGDGDPLIDSNGNFTFFGDLSVNPVRFSYRVNVPNGTIGPKTLGGVADYQLDGMFNPEPVAVPPFTLSDAAATHSVRGYLAGRRLDIDCTVSYRAERQLQSLLWVPELPPNWKLVDASGQGYPEVDPLKGAITFFGDLSPNPVTFSYTVEVPETALGTNSLGGRVDYQLDNMFNPVSTRALPDPLRVPEMHTLQIASTHGVGLPTVGVYTNFHGIALTNRINASVVIGSRTFACSGWTLAGNEPLIGSGAECALTLTNNAVLTWVWVAPLISPAGTVSATMDEDNAPLVWTQPGLSAVTTSDPAGQPAGTLSWSLKTQAAHGTAHVSGTGATPTITYMPVTNGYGSDSFVVQVTDGLGGFDQVTVSVTVNPINDAPVLAPIGDKRTDERTPLTFTVSATDVDIPAQTLAYSLDAASRSAGMAINPTTGVFTWTPTAGQAGLDLTVFPVTVTVMDNGTGPANQSDSEAFTITLDSSRATHAAVGYIAASTLTIDCAFAYPAGRQLQSLLWKPVLPAGWTLLGATGDGYPDLGSDGALVFGGGTLPNPVHFQYTVHVPASATGPQLIGGSAAYQLDGMFNPATVRAQPDPLVVPMLLTLPNLVAADKVYDGTTNATVASYGALAGVAGADQVTLVTDAARAFFDTPLAGTNKTVTVSGLTLSGANASWYAIAAQTTTAVITKAPLKIGGSFTASNKFYDGTTTAVIDAAGLSLITPVNGDQVSLTAVAQFADKNVGTGKVVSLSEASVLIGAGAGNYTLSLAGAPTAMADILFPAVSGTQACDGFRSPSAGTVISNSFVYPASETLTSLVWRPALPAGWTLVGASGNGSPSVNGTEVIFAGPFAPSPVKFAYTVAIPGNQAVTNSLNADVEFGFSSMTGTLVANELPSTLLLKRYHSADYQTILPPPNKPIMVPDGKIDAVEMQRVLLYWRTGRGEYHVTGVTTSTPDGFDVGVSGINTWFHSADFQTILPPPNKPIMVPDGKIDAVEMQRVLLYWRTGAGVYHGTNVTVNTPDGYDVGK